MATVIVALTEWVLFTRAAAEVVSIMFMEAVWSKLSATIVATTAAVVVGDCFCLSWSFGCFNAEAVALKHRTDYLGAQAYCDEPARPSCSCWDSHVLQLSHLPKNTLRPS